MKYGNWAKLLDFQWSKNRRVSFVDFYLYRYWTMTKRDRTSGMSRKYFYVKEITLATCVSTL